MVKRGTLSWLRRWPGQAVAGTAVLAVTTALILTMTAAHSPASASRANSVGVVADSPVAAPVEVSSGAPGTAVASGPRPAGFRRAEPPPRGCHARPRPNGCVPRSAVGRPGARFGGNPGTGAGVRGGSDHRADVVRDRFGERPRHTRHRRRGHQCAHQRPTGGRRRDRRGLGPRARRRQLRLGVGGVPHRPGAAPPSPAAAAAAHRRMRPRVTG